MEGNRLPFVVEDRRARGPEVDVAGEHRHAVAALVQQVMGDLAGALHFLKSQAYSNGKAGVFGTCSGGRHAYLAACRVPGFDACVDCWGGRVVMTPDQLTEKSPVAPIDYTPNLPCPILGLFGEEDQSPTPEQVAIHEAELCGSILAKVERDAYMVRMAAEYPEYGFDKHKGYGTADHLAAIHAHGVTPLHRRTFEPIKTMLSQLRLFD